MFKRTLIITVASIGIAGALDNPAHACTPAQTASYNLAVRLMHSAVDISQTVGGQKADAAVHALLDLVESIDRSLPATCGRGK